MEMNIKKTKGMVVSRKDPVPSINISIEGTPIQQVNNMIYLGYLQSENGKCYDEIKRRIARKIRIQVKLWLVRCYV